MRPTSRLFFALALLPTVAVASGQLDPGFDGDGVLVINTSSFTVASDRLYAGLIDHAGRYVGVGTGTGIGQMSGTVLRVSRSGVRDAGFGDNGVVRVPLVPGFGDIEWQEVLELPDHRLLLGGRAANGPGLNDPGRIIICRLLENGALDTAYDGDGCMLPLMAPGSTRDGLDGMALQADGRLVIVARTDMLGDNSPNEWAVARYEADGGEDPCFGDPGCVTGGVLFEPEPDADLPSFIPADIAVAPDGRIVVAGTAFGINGQDFALVKLMPNGSVDAAGFGNQGHRLIGFDQGGLNSDVGRALAVRDDGAIFVTGAVTQNTGRLAGVAAVDQFGTALPGFGVAGKATFFFNDVAFDHLPNRIRLQSDGKPVVAGETDVSGDPETLLRDCGVARLRTDGTLDPVFASDGRATFDANLGETEPLTDRCGGLALDGRRIVLFGQHQIETDGNYDALLIALDQDDLFRDGFEE